MLNEIGKHFKKKNQSDESPINVIGQIKPSVIEQGLKTALATGVWGINKTKNGVAQSLQRLSWIQGISYLRRILSPSMDESTSKVTSIRYVNNNQVQLLCCLTGDTEIVCENGIDTILIKDIVNNNSVMTINPNNLVETSSTMYNKFKLMPSELYELVTISGRVIKATSDHKFLIDVSNKPTWKRVDELLVNEKLIIRHTEKYIEPDNSFIFKITKKDSIYNEHLINIGYILNDENIKYNIDYVKNNFDIKDINVLIPSMCSCSLCKNNVKYNSMELCNICKYIKTLDNLWKTNMNNITECIKEMVQNDIVNINYMINNNIDFINNHFNEDIYINQILTIFSE
jgi:hypothetical protein